VLIKRFPALGDECIEIRAGPVAAADAECDPRYLVWWQHAEESPLDKEYPPQQFNKPGEMSGVITGTDP
jgi:hypothetical protein